MVKKAPAKAKTQKKPARAVKTTVVKKKVARAASAPRQTSPAKPKTPAAGKYAQPGAPWWKAYLPK